MNTNNDIADRVDREYAEAWKPNPGDKLIGKVVELGQREGGFGVYPIITLANESGMEWAFHAFHSVAQSELARSRPQVGETIAIKYVGERASDDGKKRFHLYKVAVDRAAQAFNWGAYSDEHEAEPDAGGGFAVPTDDVPFAASVT